MTFKAPLSFVSLHITKAHHSITKALELTIIWLFKTIVVKTILKVTSIKVKKLKSILQLRYGRILLSVWLRVF